MLTYRGMIFKKIWYIHIIKYDTVAEKNELNLYKPK